jgi:hypothetical protein
MVNSTNQGAHMRTFSALLLTVLMVAPAFAYTDEQVAACTPDVMRLCSDAIPDQSRIIKCMMQKKKQVSSACITTLKIGTSTSHVAAR